MPALITPIKIDYSKNNAQAQARKILNEARRQHKNGATFVGLTYSANHEQTIKILDTYKNNNWQTGTFGANQAQVIADIERFLETEYKDLQQVFRIVPITTMNYSGAKNCASDDEIQFSLDAATKFLEQSDAVTLGWRNQDTVDKKQLAIGGGIALKILTENQQEMIQKWVNQYLSDTPDIDLDKTENTSAPDNSNIDLGKTKNTRTFFASPLKAVAIGFGIGAFSGGVLGGLTIGIMALKDTALLSAGIIGACTPIGAIAFIAAVCGVIGVIAGLALYYQGNHQSDNCPTTS